MPGGTPSNDWLTQRLWYLCQRTTRLAIDIAANATARVGIFYSTGTNTAKEVAERVHELLGGDAVADAPEKVMYLLPEDCAAKYSTIVFGCPSYLWGGGSVSGLDFDTMVPPGDNPVDLRGINVAVFGTGDQVKYSEYFCDAMGMVADMAESRGCTRIGETSMEGYEFEYSRAARDGKFVGLAIDNENQRHLTDARVVAWVEQLKREIAANLEGARADLERSVEESA